MGLVKKMEWLKWIRKYSTGILDTKTGSMETLIDSVSSKTINYAYTSSVVADDEFINTTAPPQQRPMLPPPPPTSQDSPTPPQFPNDVYDCCVSLDGIPITHEFQYTLSDTNGCGKITKHDVEGLASKILESVYGTTLKFSSQGQRTVKVTLNVRQSSMVAVDGTPSSWSHQGRERKSKSSDKHSKTTVGEPEHVIVAQPIYGVKGSPHHRVKPGAQRYRRDQLIEMVQRSLAENLSFQSERKFIKPEGYHRTRTKRRPSNASASGALQATPQPSPIKPKTPVKVAWSPYDFEPVAHIPSHHHHHEQRKNARVGGHHHQQPLYGNSGVIVPPQTTAVDDHKMLTRHQHRAAVVSSSNKQQSKEAATQEQTKNIDHQRYKRAKLASKKIHHHIHEHHHYHHYDYYIV